MPRDLGAFHVMVNVPEFMVRVVEDGSVVHETRVIVGKPTNPTPTFSHVMSHLIVNPYWNVPTSIVSKEMLPEIRSQSEAIFARGGYQVFARVGGRMRQIDPVLGRLGDGERALRSRSARSRATSMRSAASSSCSRISTRSICTTRRRSGSSSATTAPSAMAACGWKTRSTSPTQFFPHAAPGLEFEAPRKALWRPGAAGESRHAGPRASRLFHRRQSSPTARCGTSRISTATTARSPRLVTRAPKRSAQVSPHSAG